MKKMSMFVGIGLALLMSVACEEPEAKPEAATGAPAFGIVLHGGAGTILNTAQSPPSR